MARVKKCPHCKKGKLEWIGVTEKGERRMSCSRCYKIIIVRSPKG
jgi:transposase-like protein